MSFHFNARMRPAEVLQQFVGLFADKGWLNQTLRVKLDGRRYSISCTEGEFMAYRINDNWGVSPGIPGWPVCIIDRDLIIEDSEISAFPTAEPRVHDWLRCIASSDFELLQETF